jgi:hypothetical protein
VADAFSSDGQRVLLTVRGGPTVEGGRNKALYPIFVRPADGGPAMSLGAGYGLALSPDGRWAPAITREEANSKFVAYPLGPGSPRALERGGLTFDTVPVASFAAGDRIVFQAKQGDSPPATFIQSLDGGPAARLEHEPGRIVSPVAPDGRHFISQRTDGSLWFATAERGPSVHLTFSLQPPQFIRQWSEDGQQIWILTLAADRSRLTPTAIPSGTTAPSIEIMRDRMAEKIFRASMGISADGRSVVYTESRLLSDLFLIEGIR